MKVMLSQNSTTTSNNSASCGNKSGALSNEEAKKENDELPKWFETKFDSIILNSMKQIKRKSINAHAIAMQKYLDL